MHRAEAMKLTQQSAYGSKTPCFNSLQWGCRPKPRRAGASSIASCSPLNPLRGLRPSRPPGERGEGVEPKGWIAPSSMKTAPSRSTVLK